jgi:hypothetical protein
MPLSALTTGEWIVAIVSAVVVLVSAAPVVWLCWRFVQMSDEEVARAIAVSNRRRES